MYFAVNKKNVKSFDYDLTTQLLKVTFQNGRVYEYEKVNVSYVVEMLGENADSLPKKLSATHKYKEVK